MTTSSLRVDNVVPLWLLIVRSSKGPSYAFLSFALGILGCKNEKSVRPDGATRKSNAPKRRIGRGRLC